MKIKQMFIGVFSLFCLQIVGQDNGTHIVKRSIEKQPYSYEKKVNGITVQYYTQEQFDKLPEKRKNYYLQHKECFEIIKPKVNAK
ncbi:MAG: hypothetical protein ACXVNQ_03215 [Bacteroidia bacterium]